MENQELMRYLKDAIEQETSIVEQENAISEYDRLSLLRKPAKTVEVHPNKPHEKTLNMGLRGTLLFILPFILIFALLFAATGWTSDDEKDLAEARADYERELKSSPKYAYIWRKDVDELEEKKRATTTPWAITYLSAAGIVVILLTIINDVKKNRAANAESQQNYQSTCHAIDERNAQSKKQYQQDLSTWTQTNTEMHAYMSKPLAESRALLDRFYASEIIYPKYRTLPALTSIYEYFMTGRCTELTGPHGAYNLYEDELRKDTVISQLNTVIENLEQIRHNQYMLYQQVKAIQENTAVIASELKQIKGYTIQIAQLTALNAYYAALTERNTRITMYYHL